MAKSTKIDIDHVSKLANLPLPDEQKRIFASQLTKILDYIEKIEKADTKNVEPTFNVTPNKNVTRKDTAGTCLTQDEALQNSKNTKNGQFVTKGVFKSE
ncbi:MAG: Asp-tRNA(Asn)/Glu-tRNA(Gln) amidotransferase subunit GatC [Candidatus Curtissbacteria bacterium]|nr:Asp-tRNA(Asn)/Glu-tRNA(Gln) amidotransferase subunit GatC [Candidatus Curtissbacteria bacterium]